MKKLLIIAIFLAPLITSAAWWNPLTWGSEPQSINLGAAFQTFSRSIVPIDSTENLGTSTSPWNELHINQICLTADCRTAWPVGGGGGGSSNSKFGTSTDGNSINLNSTKASIMLGNTVNLQPNGFGTGYARFQTSTSSNDIEQWQLINRSTGTSAAGCIFLDNDKTTLDTVGAASDYYGGMCFAGSNYNLPGFNGIRQNGLGVFAKDGPLTIGSGATVAASSTIYFQAGSGLDASYDMVLTGGTGRLGIGTSTPYAKLAVVGETVSAFYTATTTATSTFTGGLSLGSYLKAGTLTAANCDVKALASNGTLYCGTDVDTDTVNSKWATSTNGLEIFPSGGKYVLVGTSTLPSVASLISASSTAPQLTLSWGAGVNQWAFRNDSAGNLTISTTTVQGTATSSNVALQINTAGLPSLQIGSQPIFQVGSDGHRFASSTAPTLSSGQIDGTDAGGRVTNCSSACTITFASAYLRTPACMVFPEAGSITNTLSTTPTTASLVVTETGLGTFDFICLGR